MGRTTHQPTEARSVTQIARVAVKIGDDYHTLESMVTLAPGADDAEIAEAVETGTRIYTAQRAAMESLITALRFAPVPPRLPTKNQLSAVAGLRARVSIATVAAVYKEIGIDGPEPQTFDQASATLDRLRAIMNGVADDPAAVSADKQSQKLPASEQPQDTDETKESLPF